MHDIAKDTGVLSVNSTYCYAVMARHFKAAGIVSESDGELSGYVMGYMEPEAPDTLFIWQVGVKRKFQGDGLGKMLLIETIRKTRARFMESTITLDNQASINLFQSVARHFHAEHTFSEMPFFGKEDLGESEPPEHLMRIGPMI